MLMFIRDVLNARRRDDGASAVEYALLIGAVAALLVAAVFLFNEFVAEIFAGTEDTICDTGDPVPGCPAP